MPVEDSDLLLVWPPTLFRTEAYAMLAAGYDDEDSLGWLLDEAFADGRAVQLFRDWKRAQWVADVGKSLNSLAQTHGHPLPSAPERLDVPEDGHLQVVRELAKAAGTLPRYTPRRYYSQRRRQQQPPPPLPLTELKTAFATVVLRLNQSGYFQDAFGSACGDSRDDPDGEGQRWLAEAIGTDVPLWPLGRSGQPTGIQRDWSEDVFFDVIEALHDRVARPRRRQWHAHWDEWDYADFVRSPGRAVYRWRVNELLSRSEATLRLSESGQDAGLLVESPGDARSALVERALRTPERRVRDRVEHAVAQFRRRDATLAAKREATRTLADVLEQRKSLLKRELFSADANALFQIANQFDIRHMNEQQKIDYNPAFLDWVFWWYLATVELTNRLLADQG